MSFQNQQQSQPPMLPPEERAEILNQAVLPYVRKGFTVEAQSIGQAVLSKQKRMGWFWNTILVFATAGLWLIYVIYRALNRKTQRVVLNVDAWGRVTQH